MVSYQILETKSSIDGCSLYRIERNPALDQGVTEVVVSTSDSRVICNDPLILGVEYTRRLGLASTKALRALKQVGLFVGEERSTHVLTILRGGLNFQLREAVAHAFDWNRHGSWFISAQRKIVNSASGEWEIVEDAYSKIYPEGSEVDVVFGDVVATGTSLRHGLNQLSEKRSASVRYRSVVFFTIGGAVAGEAVQEWKRSIEQLQGAPVSCVVVYLEGIFGVATASTPLRIKLEGTDLLRRDGVFAPEFEESQYENPCFPLERCSIYDAGSRAFHIPEYLEDVIDYWSQVTQLARDGVGFDELLKERCPFVDSQRFARQDLAQLAATQVARLKRCLES